MTVHRLQWKPPWPKPGKLGRSERAGNVDNDMLGYNNSVVFYRTSVVENTCSATEGE